MTDKALVEELRLNDAEIYLPLLGKAADRIEAQAAEIERLRQKLELIAFGMTIELDAEDGPVQVWMDAGELSEIARAALGETE